jgi:hypothetical protein
MAKKRAIELRRGHTDIALDQVEHEVVPSHGGARHDELLPLSGRHQHLLQAQLHIRVVAPKGLLAQRRDCDRYGAAQSRSDLGLGRVKTSACCGAVE